MESADISGITDEAIWSEIIENKYSQLFNTFNVTGDEREVMKELLQAAIRAEQREQDLKKRPKRQAGFPGSTRKNSPNKYVLVEFRNLPVILFYRPNFISLNVKIVYRTCRIDVCQSKIEVTTPYWATNSKGKVRAIVNNKQFEQAVHQEICR